MVSEHPFSCVCRVRFFLPPMEPGEAVLLLLGVFMARYPFATPQTTRLLGLKYSIWLVRVAAVGSVTGGIWLLVRGLA